MAVDPCFHLNPQWQGSRTLHHTGTFTEYLRTDISVTSRPALDPAVFGRNVSKGLFEGKVALQVVEVVNTAEDPCKQVESTHHCFKLRLSDGHSVISAVEQSAFPPEFWNVLPGTKLLLLGPLRVRHGVALLHPSNVVVMSRV